VAERDDAFAGFHACIAERPGGNPWTHSDAGLRFEVDHELLHRLLAVPLREGRRSESGRLAKAIDAWLANELRRAGFPADEVWPRLEHPRVLPRDVGLLLERLPAALRARVAEQVGRLPAVAPSDARVLGRAYVKQVDVVMSQWARGPELLVSTKSMVSSFRNNLANRFEESYGDAKNLRGRHPLAAMGFLFLLRSTVLDDPAALERAIDMLRKLRAEKDVYDATCLVVAEWEDETTGVRIRSDAVPPDLGADAFLQTLVEAVLDRTPIEMHVEARGRRRLRPLAVEESAPVVAAAGSTPESSTLPGESTLSHQ
jgi:hypothetical protein